MKRFFYLYIILLFSFVCANENESFPVFYKQCAQNTNLPFLQVEYLYWKTQNNGFISGTIIEGVSSNSLKTRPFQPDFKWDSGFRVSCGWSIPYDCWGISANYTYFRTQVLTNFTADNNEAISGYWTLTDELASSGEVSWKFREDLIDVILGKLCHIGKSYFIFPYIGGRYGWLDQDF